MPKTMETTYYLYDELENSGKTKAYDYYLKTVASKTVDDMTNDLLSSVKSTFQSIGVDVRGYSINPNQQSYIDAGMSEKHGIEIELAALDTLARENFELPVGKSDGSWVGDDIIDLWNSEGRPFLNNLFNDLVMKLIEREDELNGEGFSQRELYQNLVDYWQYDLMCSFIKKHDEVIADITSEITQSISDDIEYVTSHDAFEDWVSQKDYYFDIDGNYVGVF